MENQRVRLTKTLLKNALIEMLEETPLERITIYSLCERAGINRTTFYKYYGSQYDLFNEIERELFDTIDERLKDIENGGKLSISATLECIKQEGEKIRILMNSGADKDFSDKVFGLTAIRTITEEKMPPYRESGLINYMTTFYYSGCYAVIKEWVNGGFAESPDTINRLLLHLMNPEKE